MAEKYSTLYNINCRIGCVPDNKTSSYVTLSPSDIVSLSFIHNYDIATYPIIRLRAYVDLSIFELITTYPDAIQVSLQLESKIGNMNYNQEDGNGTVQVIDAGQSAYLNYKGYLENKNTPTSIMDSYEQGNKKDSNLNTTRKVPLTLFCYNYEMIHNLKRKNNCIYKDMDLTTIIENMSDGMNYDVYMDPIRNQTKYDQILIPNINIKDTFVFFEKRYGLYPKGGLMYGDDKTLYIVDTDVESGDVPIPIYVESYKNSSDMGGLKKYSSSRPKYMFVTKAENVSVITESDIEKVLNSPMIEDINVNTSEKHGAELSKIFTSTEIDKAKRTDQSKMIKGIISKIETPDTLHKSISPFISSTTAARITERVTRVDISGVGFDVFKINPRSRFNLIFESPIRGMSINQRYRASTVVHTFTNLSSNYFIAQTTMNLCSN